MTDDNKERLNYFEKRINDLEEKFGELKGMIEVERREGVATRRLNLIIRLVLYSIVIILVGLMFLISKGYIKI